MSNPIDPLGQPYQPVPKSQVPVPQTGIGNRIRATSTGFFGRLLSLPDRNPKMRYVFDIGIIAIAVISIVGILVASQGQGLLLFGLIPGLIFGALGVTMLISDIANTPRSQKIADTITAVLLPFILLGIASALIASAYFTAGGSTLILANPQFLMGFMTIGLALVSLSKVTFQHFKTESLIKAQQKVIEVSEQSLTPSIPSEKDVKRVSQERKRDLASDARRKHDDQETRTHTRHRHISRGSQGVLQHRSKNQIASEQPDSSLDLNDEYDPLVQEDFALLNDIFNPFSPAYQPPQSVEESSFTAQNVPLGQPIPGDPRGIGPITSTPRKVPRVGATGSLRPKNRDEDEERQERDQSSGDDESSDVENPDSQRKQSRKKKRKKS
ncbi:IncV family inclusion membrane protein [Chlamydia sp. 12-01]|uniref:IncV family inclusion membrane protein n=1 Tax=Chlamydia sp. 12-01 TaxID=3002742 RepID=UPI0035D46AED